MIACQTIQSRALAKLDSEGSDRFKFDQDFKYAINGAIEDLVTMLNEAFAENKLAPENLRELSKTKVWVANSYSRVAFNPTQVGHNLWSIISVYPDCKTNRVSAIANGGTATQSKYRPDVSYTGGGKPAKRLTNEEWTDGEDNVFMAGNSILQGKMKEYAYLDFSDYTSTSYSNTDGPEITIRPDVSNKFVAITYLKYPTPVTQVSDNVEFPESLTELITDMVVNKIAYKEGEAPLIQITAASINKLVNLIK